MQKKLIIWAKNGAKSAKEFCGNVFVERICLRLRPAWKHTCIFNAETLFSTESGIKQGQVTWGRNGRGAKK
jgi:hypothetical protein